MKTQLYILPLLLILLDQVRRLSSLLDLSKLSETLCGNPRHAVRFVNENTWDAAHDWNVSGAGA